MLSPSSGSKSWSLKEAISKRWSEWTRRDAALAELKCSGESEVERISKDFGMSAPEFRALVAKGPHAADLLLRRMAQMNLDKSEVARSEPATFHDLQRVCSLCASKRRCRRDLASNATDQGWQDYCPNAETLKALDAMPWLSRREW